MRKKKIISAVIAFSMLSVSAAGALGAEVGESLKIKDYAESAQETQALIDKRPDIQRPMENLNRGAVAVHMGDYVYLSWRWLGTESADTRYNVYRDGKLLNSEPLNATNFIDLDGMMAYASSQSEPYKIVPVVNGEEQTDKAETAGFWIGMSI